ncbi:isochorismatase family protein [Gaiella sp.]|jgi:nicotinamidase-related amidase|uniref:isochorismatase family protein n=1 Tax=Gaiella sp. TaxID=2663207 RepID=UPI002E347391|nr:isochorismatase family protein [Gaiella sp.]HEX5582357.1 isochorismatase family protein [Gaiella sp.]
MGEMQFEGFGQRAGGVGTRPALVIVDMNNGFTDPESPLVCELDDTIDAIGRLLDVMRRAGLPIVFTTVSFGEGDKVTAKAFIDKVPVLLTLAAGTRWVEIDDRIAPREDEVVLNKLFASAFFGTALSSLLASHGCDSVIVTGASTSGCVRATAVDALQHGYRPIVPREAVGDRNPAAHDASLYDIDLKYGDVVSLDECVDALEELAAAHAR